MARSARVSGCVHGRASAARSIRRVIAEIGFLAVAGALCVQPLSAGTSIDFRQAANNDSGFGLGNTHWISSVIQNNNSSYYESMSVMQRVVFAGLPATSGNHHSLLFRHQFTKAGVHAYDFLTSYAQAQADNAGALGVTIVVNPCGADLGPPASLAALCSALHAGTNIADVIVPADSFVSKNGSTTARIAAYEAGHGPRTLRILGDAPVSNAVLSVCHDVADGGDTGDSFALYALTWDSAAANIIIEMAGHLAISGDGTGATWGTNVGAGFISGGSYHFKLDSLAGALTDNNCPPGQNQKETVSLGSQDNQMQAPSVLPPPPCNIAGPTPVCPGSTNIYQGASFGPNLTYSWSVTGNGSVLGPTTSSNVAVLAGEAGSYTLRLILTATSGPLTTNSTCSLPVMLYPRPPCAISGSELVCPSSTNGYSGPDGMASYAWSIDGAGIISGSAANQTIDVASSSGCNTNFTLTLLVIDTNGCFNTCNQTTIVRDITPPVITCPPQTNAAEYPRFSGGAVVNYQSPTATDNCTANPAVYNSPPPNSLFPVGTNIVIGTAVDNCNNSNSCSFIVRVIPYQVLVANTNDSGPGSLRQALLDANDSPDENYVVLNLPGPAPHTIQVQSPLPEITSPIIIDGWSQGVTNGPPGIELVGPGGGNPIDGLVITAGNSTVRGLALNGFATAIRLGTAGGNIIQGNYIGTDVTGTIAAGNSGDGIYISSPGNIVGGTTPGTGNVISANAGNGVVLASSSASNNVIQGNWIGTGAGGVGSLGNGANGVFLTGGALGNLIGGTAGGAPNVIALNGGTGITLDATAGNRNGLLGNRILSNAGLGIDLGGDGVTPNDADDSDTGPNDYQNFPVLTDVHSIDGTTTIFGNLSSLPNATYRIEFYLNDNADPSGYGEGQTLIASTTVTTTAGGTGSFGVSLPLVATYTQFVTATATGPQNNTSEYSKAAPVRTPPILGSGPVSTNIPVGNTAMFCVTAVGTQPIQYQWRLNGFNIPGATNACYTVPTAQIGQGGTYTVVVGNDLNAVATLPASLTLVLTNIPAGTNFASRVTLTGLSGLIRADNRNGSFEPGAPQHAGHPGGKAVWYTWTAPVTGVVTMQTAGSTFDTLLAIYTGNAVTNLVVIDSDEGHGGFYTSKAMFNVFAGNQYQIAIDGFGGATGDFILTWQEQDTSHLLPIFVTQPASQTVAPGQDVTFGLIGARVCGNGQINCDNPNPQLAYQWFFYGNPIPGATTNTLTVTNVQPANVGIYNVTIATPYQTNQSDDAVLQINLTGSLVEDAQATDKLLDANHSVILGNSGAQAAEYAGASVISPRAGTIVRGYTGTQIFNTTGSATGPGEVICGVIGGASDWITIVADASGTLYLNTDGSSYDTVMAVFRRSPTNSAVLELLACDNNGGTNGLTSSLNLPVTQGQTNYVVVDGVSGVSGILQLNYSLATSAIIKTAGLTPQGAIHLQVVSRPDLHFSIQASPNLGTWTTLVTATNPPSGVYDYFDSNSVAIPKRYYRALLLP